MNQVTQDLRDLFGPEGAERLAWLTQAPTYAGASRFTQDDVMILAYPDHIYASGPTLEALSAILSERFGALASSLHLLPPFPSTSDWGFAPLDHRTIAPAFGDWSHITALAQRFKLSLDLILNHVASEHGWFQSFLAGRPDAKGLFITVNPGMDFTNVARSRHHPPISNHGAPERPLWVWTRYGRDQIDLNWCNPEVLVRFAELIRYYAAKGIVGLRLDALPFIWKEDGTSCSNLPQTIQILRILRRAADLTHPSPYLIAEADTIMGKNPYVGEAGDLGQLSYRYESAQIVLHMILASSKAIFDPWIDRLASLAEPGHALNLLTTHDGIYLRPKDPPLPKEALQVLMDRTLAGGGHVIWREVAGEERPYELDITLPDLLDGPDGRMHGRLSAALAVISCLPGIPLLYLGTLLGIRNAYDLVARTGDSRAINRGTLHLDEALERLAGGNPQSHVVERLSRFLKGRRRLDAFAPHAPIRRIAAGDTMVAFERLGVRSWAGLYLSLHPEPIEVALSAGCFDVETGRPLGTREVLQPYDFLVAGRDP